MSYALDPSGRFYLFGGNRTDFALDAPVNELWRFSGTSWTWLSGSDGPPDYGTLGVAAPANRPTARPYAAAWTDLSG